MSIAANRPHLPQRGIPGKTCWLRVHAHVEAHPRTMTWCHNHLNESNSYHLHRSGISSAWSIVLRAQGRLPWCHTVAVVFKKMHNRPRPSAIADKWLFGCNEWIFGGQRKTLWMPMKSPLAADARLSNWQRKTVTGNKRPSECRWRTLWLPKSSSSAAKEFFIGSQTIFHRQSAGCWWNPFPLISQERRRRPIWPASASAVNVGGAPGKRCWLHAHVHVNTSPHTDMVFRATNIWTNRKDVRRDGISSAWSIVLRAQGRLPWCHAVAVVFRGARGTGGDVGVITRE